MAIAIFLLSFLPGSAQGVVGDDGQPILFRGRVSRRYNSATFNGTPYLDHTGSKIGTVIFDGVLYPDVLIDYDASLQEIGVRQDEDHVSIIPDRRQIPWFTMGDRKFVNLRYLGVDSAAEGFYEVLMDGDIALLDRVDKKMLSFPGDHNTVKELGYIDPDYRSELITYYKIDRRQWSLKDGVLSKVKGKKAFQRLQKQIILPASGPGPVERAAAQWHEVSRSSIHMETPSVSFQKNRSDRGSLPEGYFMKDMTEELARLDSLEESVRAMYQNKIYQIGDPAHPQRGKVKISGTVRDAATGQPLPDVTVWDDNTSTYALTDARGQYSITIPVGENVINFNELTKQDMHLKVVVNGSGGLDLTMTERVTMLNSAMISADTRMNHRTAKIGLERVSIKTINKIPSAFGEGDILRAVLTLPGVKTVGEASGGFNVRGGSADQNLILFNEGTIYNPSHMFGVFSAFNPDVVEGVELLKSSIPAEYGGRVSSVLDVKGKDGSFEKINGSLGIGLMTSRLHLEGPLKKGKTSFLLGGRMTYSDWMLKRIKSSNYKDGTADFSDLNFGFTHKANDNNTIQLYGYWSQDNFSFSPDTTFHYNNLNAALRWKHKGAGRTSFSFSTGIDLYGNTLDETPHSSEYEAFNLETAINQAFARLKFETAGDHHVVSYGTEVLGYALEGGHIKPMIPGSAVIERSLETEYAIQPSVYLGDEWTAGGKFLLDYGVRLSSFYAKDPAKLYAGPEFRLSGKYSVNNNLSFKAGFNSMRQYIHLISNTTAISPMDTWKLCDENILPVDGWQAASGMYWTVFDGKVDLSLEGYWKNTWNELDYKSGATLVMNDHLADDLVRTKGKAYGVEFMAKKTIGKLSGWASYSYSRTFLKEMEDRGINTINRGEWYSAAYDKPHDFKLVANYAITARYSLSANLDYSTGRPVTIPVGYYQYGGGYRLAYSARNSYRIPDYFRLDLALNIDPGHYLKALTHASFTLGCYNVTGRKNTYSVFYSTDQGRNLKGYRVCVFATQIPYINLNILF